ncbi:hypothetical protein BOTBODRAFT_377101 [Botryobasidium botryosum FD-172 SS1]|uniref:Uncharacterized protein n=1 Tax=Botryobasidium botryosum (strain FD-172 SS1) TaxID=930990 RepID=A0A067N7N6_BOTB1|nr:hypothetical protein BOTBODRAFT_377101 [Botryobasidium botryosum FD-172 SS1]
MGLTQMTRDEVSTLELAWWYKLCYHDSNLLLLIEELDGLAFGYTSLLINYARSNKAIGKGDQVSHRI